MPFKRIEKPFVLSDSSLNVYGFKLLTDGYVAEEFRRNPIGYYNHLKDDGVLIKWEDLKVIGDDVIGTPTVNLSHPRGQRTADEIEEGFLNAASVGKLCILDAKLEDNPDDPSTPIIVGTKWYNKEASVVDNPGNRKAMKVELVDADGNEINLSDIATKFSLTKKTSMVKKIEMPISKELAAIFSDLTDDYTPEQVVACMKKALEENGNLKDENKKLTDKLAELTTSSLGKEVAAILQKGLEDKKLTVALKEKLAVQFKDKPAELKDLIDTMQPQPSVADAIEENKEKKAAKVKDLKDKDWDTLDKEGKLQDLKDSDYDLWAEKFETRFGKKPRKG